MTCDPIEGGKFSWNDVVHVVADAPEKFRPGELGNVVGGWRVVNERVAEECGEPLGALLLTVEYYDGSDAQVPERYLVLAE